MTFHRLVVSVSWAPAIGLLVATTPAPRAGGEPVGGILVSASVQHDIALSRCIGGTPDRPSPHSEFEPHAGVNPRDPRNVLVSWNTVGQDHIELIRAAASFDGGQSWTPPETLPFTACSGGPSKLLTGVDDTWVAFGPDGRLYVSAVGYGQKLTSGGRDRRPDYPFGVLVSTSSDAGRTWKTALVGMQTGPHAAFDNSAVTAHPLHPGTAFLLTTRGEEPPPQKGSKAEISSGAGQNLNGHFDERAIPRPAALARTVDGGQTWTQFVAISPRQPGDYADAPQMVIDRRTGHMDVFYSNGLEGGSILMVKSTDDGKTWAAPITVAQHVSPRTMATILGLGHSLAFAEDIIHPAIDGRTGRLYVAFADGRFTNQGPPQIAMTSSNDGGKTWTEPRRVSDAGAFASVLPSIEIADDGRVGVTFFETTTAPTRGAPSVLFEIHERVFDVTPMGDLSSIHDRLIERFTFEPVRGAQGPVFLGDYFGLVSVTNAFHAVYAKSVRRDNGAGGSASADVFFGR